MFFRLVNQISGLLAIKGDAITLFEPRTGSMPTTTFIGNPVSAVTLSHFY